MPIRAAFPIAPVVAVHAEPRVSSAQVTQALYGHLLLVLASEGDWQRVRTARDGYEGWAHAGCLTLFDPPDLDALVASDPDAFGPTDARRWNERVRPGEDSSASLADALGGSQRVPLVSLGSTIELDGRTLRLPLGALIHTPERAHVSHGEVTRAAERGRFPARGSAVVDTLRTYFESVSYQWGGVTPWGADCSGMVQAAYALHGVELPRDARQQALVGADVGADPAGHAPGDLVFFSDRDDGRVTHVAVAAGGGAVCHCALGRGGWAVDGLAEPADAYAEGLARRVAGARRVLA